MAGMGLVLDIARQALTAQRYGIDVTAHNIANVHTPGYSRQRPVHEARAPEQPGGLLFGHGVDTDTITRVSDQFIENQLMEQKAGLHYSEEMEKYMQVIEGLFSEDSETSISTLLAGFWNLWHDISNNPGGSPERGALLEHSILLSEQFNTVNSELRLLEKNLTDSVRAAVDKINQVAGSIAMLNGRIIGVESNSVANDLRDKRNLLMSELSEYIGINTFQEDNGTFTVVTAKGCTIVQGTSSYDMRLGGTTGDRVEWGGSGGAVVDITDYIVGGRTGGWLDMRDEVLAKYRLDLDSVAGEFIWTVNAQHSQGVGLNGLSSVTGDAVAVAADEAVGTSDSGLASYDRIQDGSFKIWLYDDSGAVVVNGGSTITIDADTTPLYDTDALTSDIVAQIDAIHANLSASVSSGKLQISGSSGYTFAFSEDTSNALAALGINTYYAGANAGGIRVSDAVNSNRDLIAAAQIESDGTFASGDNRNARAITDLQYTASSIPEWTVDRIAGTSQGSTTANIEEYYHGMVGSMGILSASITSEKDINEMMVHKMGEIRDSISAVSLDEEMTNLIKYQHAYTAAAKLIRTSDEMLQMLLDIV